MKSMVPILMYHQVEEIPFKFDPLGLSVSPAQFDKQMSYLFRNGYHCLSLYDIVRKIRENWHEPPKSFVITFDDGYQNVLTNASPILQKYGFSATVFLVANQLGSMSNWWGQVGDLAGCLLSCNEVFQLIQKGFTIGSHSLNHKFLNQLDEESAIDEISKSKKQLEDLFNVSIDFFSYPFSRTDSKIQHLVELSGYKASCAGDCGRWGIYNLWRVPCLRKDTSLVFQTKVNGLYDFRTSLRESSLGLNLRHQVRRARKLLGFRHLSRSEMMNNLNK